MGQEVRGGSDGGYWKLKVEGKYIYFLTGDTRCIEMLMDRKRMQRVQK